MVQGEQIVPLTPTDKRLRTLRKKIQQIQTLKNKKENGEVLEATQVNIMFLRFSTVFVKTFILHF